MKIYWKNLVLEFESEREEELLRDILESFTINKTITSESMEFANKLLEKINAANN